MTRGTTVLVAILMVAMLSVAFFVATRDSSGIELPSVSLDALDRPASDEDRPVTFVVNPGDSATSIGERLERQGLIASALTFRLLVGQYGVERNLTAGEYVLSPAMTTTGIIQTLNRGAVRTVTVTIPEGWRWEQMAARVEREGLFSRAEFEAALGRAQAQGVIPGIPEGQGLQGYLFPDTYRIQPSMTADEFVALLLRGWRQVVTPEMEAQFAARGLTTHQAMTLAAIVEREAVSDSERPIIASVFYNRIRDGMPLQADPTVQYAIATPESVAQYGWWKTGLTVTDLRAQNPYNTYVVRTLPPGPIASPGRASIEAVANPATTDYFYFVARDARSHLFARTLEEHNRNVAQVRSGR